MKKKKLKKLISTSVTLKGDIRFTIMHNFEVLNGNINTFYAALSNWFFRTKDYTPESFVNYVKSKNEYGRIIMTEAEFQTAMEQKN